VETDTTPDSSTETETTTDTAEVTTSPETEVQKAVPYERFKEVNELAKEGPNLKKELEELRKSLNPAPAVDPQTEQAKQYLKNLGFVSKEDVEREIRQRDEDSKVEQELSRLENEWNGKDGRPKFDRKQVIDYCIKNGIGNPEVGFKALKEQDLINFHVQQAIARSKGVKTEASDGSGSTQVGVTNDDLKEAAMKGDKTALRTLIKRQVFGTK